jgi:hypothetical protein
MRPKVWQAVGVRALIGLSVLAVFTIAIAAYHAGLRNGRGRR